MKVVVIKVSLIVLSTVLVEPQIINFNNENPIKEALFLNNQSMFNTTLKNCSWRPTANNFECPEGDVSYYLYSGGKKEQVPNNIADWLKGSIWNPYLDNVFIIHGYAGGDNTLPIVVLRDEPGPPLLERLTF
ncbi:uncharacterized protein LOC112906449 [Agrilus planipennis]|uniref:Uncharacterized protein LOC112906449 n=1 Tax=Agrilus planipennis TaxID=224129 RepID=A0A7F5RKK4_AGRPL|nr:uncharacterized protein LOC112906449 [Agrilus planipennis]